jgi:uncharacterized protein YjbI with pentapeptide repeats
LAAAALPEIAADRADLQASRFDHAQDLRKHDLRKQDLRKQDLRKQDLCKQETA